MDVSLVVERGGKRKKSIRLKSEETIIGRRQDCDLRIQSEAVSRRHALVSVHDGRVTIEDLDSVNGTFVNEERISGRQLLMPGDRLEIGPIEFVIEFEMTQTMLDDVRSPRTRKHTIETNEDDVEMLPLAEDDDGMDVLPVVDEEDENQLDALEIVDDPPFKFDDAPKQKPAKPAAKAPAKPAPKKAPPPPPPPANDDDPIPVMNDFDDLGGWSLPKGEGDMRDLLSGMSDKPKQRPRNDS